MRSSGDWRKLGLRAGEDVQVRSRDEILRTLDADGRLDGLPFQPEMLAYCGQRLRVWKVAHKTCDTINKTGGRRMSDAVHLEGVRCDGSAHGECQANCLLFWKEAWLKRPGDPDNLTIAPAACEEAVLWRNVTVEGDANLDNDPTWVCQITRLFAATTPLSGWDARQYLQDIQHGNVSAWKMLCTLTQAGYSKLVFTGIGYRALIWLFNRWQKLRGGKPFPLASGLLPRGVKTPTGELDLQVGEWVRIKSADEIRATLGPDAKNRGLLFDPEMVKFCGERHQVQRRVLRLIEEPTGKMIHMKNPCIVLQDVYCRGECTPRRLGCPRAIDSYWREIWLRRAPDPPAGGK
jgi:hypothetical protein